jgi:hypothetical protein
MEEVFPATTGLEDEAAGDRLLLLRRQAMNRRKTPDFGKAVTE